MPQLRSLTALHCTSQGTRSVTGWFHLHELHQESPGCCCIGATLEQPHGYVTALLRLCCGCCYDSCISQERINMSAFRLLLLSSFSLLSGALTAWGSVSHVNSVISKMTGVINRISNTVTILMCWLQIP